MAAFAAYSDLEARWKPLSASEQATAATLLGDASAIIRAECSTADAIDPELTKYVACAMVKRAMIAADSDGVSSQMEVAGPFTQQRAFANPLGNLYLTKQDKRLLGIRQKAFSIDLLATPPETP